MLSLFLGRRIWSGGPTREFGSDDALGQLSVHWHVRPTWNQLKNPVLPHLVGGLSVNQVSLDSIPHLLGGLPTLTALESVSLVRAARQYQLAVWIAEEDPELAWLQLISAVEVVAISWRRRRSDPTGSLADAMPELVEEAGGDALVARAAELLSDLTKSTSRFLDFMMAFEPGPPLERCPTAFQVPWGELRDRLALVYRYRSRRLHSGESFPSALHESPFEIGQEGERARCAEIPPGLAHFVGASHWPANDLPMYLWLFERTVRAAILRWYEECIEANAV